MITLKKLRDFCFLFQPQMLYVISYFLATNCIFLLISFKYRMKCNNYLFVLESVSKELWRIKIFAGLKVLQDIFGEPKKNILEDEYFLFLSTETTLQNKQNHSINLRPKAYLASFTWAVLLNSKFLFGGTRLGLFAFFIKQFSKDKQKMLNIFQVYNRFVLSIHKYHMSSFFQQHSVNNTVLNPSILAYVVKIESRAITRILETTSQRIDRPINLFWKATRRLNGHARPISFIAAFGYRKEAVELGRVDSTDSMFESSNWLVRILFVVLSVFVKNW